MSQLDFLKERRPSPHFELLFGWRDAEAPNCVGIHGVRDEGFVESCYGALARAFDYLAAAPLELPVPPVKVPVYIFEIGSVFPYGGSPFTYENLRGEPYIAIPCRIAAPTRAEEYRHTMAAAVHEAFHAMAWRLHSARDVNFTHWRWFHEGCAVWTEMQVMPDVVDYLQFGMNWCDHPDVPIDDDDALYESGFFVRYLAARFGPEWLGRIWRLTGNSRETPWDVMRRMAPGDLESLLLDYFRDAFFIADDTSPAHSPDLVARYVGRQVTRALRLTTEETTSFEGTLDHLACHYYTVTSPTAPAVRRLETKGPIQVEITGITKDGRRTAIDAEAARWLVTVGNVGLRPVDDRCAYNVDIEAATKTRGVGVTILTASPVQ